MTNNIHETPTGDLLVQLPKSAKSVMILRDNGIDYLDYLIGNKMYKQDLPKSFKGSYLGIASTLSEDDSKRVSEKAPVFFWLYRSYDGEGHFYKTAKESLLSQVKALGWDAERTGVLCNDKNK